MAESNTWDSIQNHGLLSTSAILDLHDVNGEARSTYEAMHRPEMTTISSGLAPTMVLRDQKPMAPNRLSTCLMNGITASQWYSHLNGRVFFWATEERLLRLLSARAYRSKTHDVLTIDTASLMADYGDQIELCHMNSGNTFPMSFPRDYSIFKRIEDYPTRPNGNPLKIVAEVTIPYSAPNIVASVLEVKRMRGATVLETLFQGI